MVYAKKSGLFYRVLVTELVVRVTQSNRCIDWGYQSTMYIQARFELHVACCAHWYAAPIFVSLCGLLTIIAVHLMIINTKLKMFF